MCIDFGHGRLLRKLRKLPLENSVWGDSSSTYEISNDSNSHDSMMAEVCAWILGMVGIGFQTTAPLAEPFWLPRTYARHLLQCRASLGATNLRQTRTGIGFTPKMKSPRLLQNLSGVPQTYTRPERESDRRPRLNRLASCRTSLGCQEPTPNLNGNRIHAQDEIAPPPAEPLWVPRTYAKPEGESNPRR